MHQLTESLFVSPQISLEDIPAIKQDGIRTVICNRPDGEEEDQIDQEHVARSCKQHGLEFIYQPVQSSAIDEGAVRDFARHIEGSNAPVLAYCRTGTRCTILWAMSAREQLGDAEILKRAEQGGYDLSRFFPPRPGD